MDSTALIIGDFSNGNDGIVLKGEGKSLADLKGMEVNLVELSVSHYLLARGLETRRPDRERPQGGQHLGRRYGGSLRHPRREAVATWNPLLAEIEAMPERDKVFDSSQIPGEIIDLMVVNSDHLQRQPRPGQSPDRRLVRNHGDHECRRRRRQAAREHMAQASGTDLAGYEAQLAATRMFYSAADAVAFATSPQLPDTMTKVAEFSFAHGLLGEGAPDAGAVGMAFPGGVTTGDKGQPQAALRPDLHADGGRRQALSTPRPSQSGWCFTHPPRAV